MKILLLTHAYNCLCQRLHIELTQMDHDVTIEFDINDDVFIDAVDRFSPEIIIAPFLKRAIPAQVWQNSLCWIIHPGIVGDRGPSSLDWAIINQEKTWGVTIIQANEVMDGGDIWASETFAMRNASKSSIYREEVTVASIKALKRALNNYQNKSFRPTSLNELSTVDSKGLGQWRCLMTQADRSVNWMQDCSEVIIRKIHSADGNPGLLATLLNQECYLFNASIDHNLSGEAGTIISTKNNAIAIATIDGAIWVSHLRLKPINKIDKTLKLPATLALASQLLNVPLNCAGASGYKEIWHQIQSLPNGQGEIAYLYFNFHNGAMSTEQCESLLAEYQQLAKSTVSAIILMGGSDFWSNGIHLNIIEASSSAADESWRNINAMNDVCKAIIETTDKLTVAAINGNIGAGGVFMALACDLVAANEDVVLNPHYKSMGNLFGSEYWTYLLPARVGKENAQSITKNRLPIGAIQARELGLLDLTFAKSRFLEEVINTVKQIIVGQDFDDYLLTKQAKRLQDESEKSLQCYRDEELTKMELNFYGFDSSYHVARYHFVYKLEKSRTPSYLAKHKKMGYQNNHE
ncbi:MAG: hydrogenase maturation protein [Colwellia sp.]|nr:hydrogenase maturation protein [Colwellia sp.]